MIRQHQFKKVELVSITTPEQSRDEHERMTRLRRRGAQAPGPAFPHNGLVRGRHGLRSAEDLRHRGLAAGAGAVSRNLFLLDLRRLSGSAHERPHQRRGRQGDPLRPHAQWLGRRGRPSSDRGAGKLPAVGRLGRRPGRFAALYGRASRKSRLLASRFSQAAGRCNCRRRHRSARRTCNRHSRHSRIRHSRHNRRRQAARLRPTRRR